MEREILFNKPPMIFTELTPNEIVGYDNMQILVAHLQICFSATNSGEFPHGRLNKEIGAGNREMLTKVLNELRENGYHPMSVDENGKIRWGVVLKSDSQVEFEKGLPALERMSEKELQDMGRGGYREIIKNTTVEPFNGHGISRNEAMGAF